MNKELEAFIQELDKLMACHSRFALDKEFRETRATSLYAFVEQKMSNQLVRDLRRDGRCPICGSEVAEN